MDFDKAVPARGSKNRSDRNFNRARKERFRIAYNFDIRRYPRVFRPRPRRSNQHKQLLFCNFSAVLLTVELTRSFQSCFEPRVT